MALITQYSGPFEGINLDVPSIFLKPNECEVCDDFILRNKFIISRPSFIELPSTSPGDGFPISGLAQTYVTNPSFGGVIYYILVVTRTSIYTYDGSSLHLFYTFPTTAPLDVFDYVTAIASCIIVNGNQEVYQAIMGTGVNALTGGMFGSRFIMELAQTLMIGNTYEAGTNYPFRVRWCNAGSITQWDPFAYTGAGFNDLLDTSDVITGLFPIGSVGYILRSNGITQVSPTGNGIQPWYFNHWWAAEQGIGLVFANTLAQYGGLVFLLAEDNVYEFTTSSIRNIGDKVIDQIIADIAANNVNVYGPFYPYGGHVFAAISPKYTREFRQFEYSIYINNPNTLQTIIWSYDLSAKAWTRKNLGGYLFWAKPMYGYSTAPSAPPFEALLFPTSNALLKYDTPNISGVSNFNTNINNTYRFKVEQQQELKYNSVSWIGIRYKNIDTSLVTVTVITPSGNFSSTLLLGDSTKSKLYYNGGDVPLAIKDGKSYVALYSFHPITESSFQIQIQRTASTGGLQIEQILVFGEQQEEAR